MKVHEAVARAVRDCGVQTLFGVQGEANLHVIAHLVHRHDVRYLKAAREDGAVLMADGFARLTGSVGVATVTKGPGLTNTVTALTTAVRARTPLVLLTGTTRADDPWALQRIDQQAVVAPTGAGYVRLTSSESVGDQVAMTFRRAGLESRPMVLDLPLDVQGQDVQVQDVHDLVSGILAEPAAHSELDAGDLDRAMGIMASARRPIIVAGQGAVRSSAQSQILALAQRLGAPVASTLMAKDIFRGAPFDLGVFGTLSTTFAQRVIGEADCVIAVGASLNPKTTSNGTMVAGRSVVHIDTVPQRIGECTPVDGTLIGDARHVCATIVELLDKAGHEPSGFASPALAAELAAYRVLDDVVDHSTRATVDSRVVSVLLDEILPSERTLVNDAGRFMRDAITGLHAPGPGSFLSTISFASMGMGMATAVGAAVARPDRPTVLVIGDGGLMMSMQELSTAVRYGLDLIVLVYNNGAYGAEVSSARDHGLSVDESIFDWAAFAPIAAAYGAVGLTVENLDDLDFVGTAVKHRDRPILVDLKLDPMAPSGFA